MKTKLFKISAQEWEAYETHAHRAVFAETLPPGTQRIDFALLVVDEATDKPVAYMTLRELDSANIYMKHGGSFDLIRGTGASLSCYKVMLEWLEQRYKNLTTLVENTNIVYLKMAMSQGFRVIGIRNFQGTILLELLKEV